MDNIREEVYGNKGSHLEKHPEKVIPDNIELTDEEKKCKWKDTGEMFKTECGQSFYFDHDVAGWIEKVFKYCPYCAKKIKVVSDNG